MRIAYLLGGYIKDETIQLIRKGEYPRFEYNLFMERNNTKAITYSDVQGSDKFLSKWAVSHKMLHVGLSSVLLEDKNKYDIVITSGEDVGIPLSLHTSIVGLKKPIYIITHGSYFGSDKLKRLMKFMRFLPNIHYLCLSNSLREFMINVFKVHPKRVFNTGYGVDTDFFIPRTNSSDRFIIASAGTANRDYELLISSILGLDVELRIAADSAWFPSTPRIPKETLPPNVEIRSYECYNALKDLYASSRIVIVPLHSANHACGYAVIGEAMAMGKPVIATKTNSHSDFIIDGETGFYVSPGNKDEMREKIKYLMDNPDIACAMGKRGRERMERLFSLSAYCERLENAMGLNKPITEP
jgi:glycosyltransferase involved in cell wall biosynthesis